MPLVSVIIPVYDAGPYLDACLTSVRGQTHTDLQIICVDDGSGDQSPEVLRRHADADGRIQLITQSRTGPGAARNVGVGGAVGDYLMFVDADDLLPRDAVEKHLGSLTSGTADFSTGRVLRMAGSHQWTSSMHDRALTRAASATHVFRSAELLYDTTSWNKLFRREYWTSHRYAFLEGVCFEDVAVMTEAHCRATSVDVLADVVYRWRRRDDGTLSITMRRDDPELLRDRLASLTEVRRLLAQLAPAGVRRGAELKFLRHDLGSYLTDLEETPTQFQRTFVRLVGEFVAGCPAVLFDQLPTPLRVSYELIRQDRSGALIDFLVHLHGRDGTLPVRRRGPALHTDLGPATSLVPRRMSSATRGLPLRMGVHRLAWHGENLVIEGYGFIDGVALGHPAAAVRRLRLVDRDLAQQRAVWLAPVRLPRLSSRVRMTPSYEWSAFRVEIPPTLLDPGPGHQSARWQVNLQVLALGAASGSAFGPPAPGDAVDLVGRSAAGLLVRAHWIEGKRLMIEATRIGAALVSAVEEDGRIRLGVRLPRRAGSVSSTLRLTADGRQSLELPLVPAASSADGVLADAVLDPADLVAGGRGVSAIVFRLDVVGSGEAVALTCELARAYSQTSPHGVITIGGDGGGAGEIVVAPAGAVVVDVGWRHDRLVVTVLTQEPAGASPVLAWSHDDGDLIDGQVRRTGERFEVIFDVTKVPGPDGDLPLRSGRWRLLQQGPDGAYSAALTTGDAALATERSPGTWAESVRVVSDRQRALVMWAEALPAAERSALAQRRLRNGPYPQALRSPLQDIVLIECWGGRTFSDSPRALAQRAASDAEGWTVVVAVADRSVAVPPGMTAVIAGSRVHHEHRARARMIIANDSLPAGFVKRPGQRYLQTWHGTPLKRIGLDIERIRFRHPAYRQDLLADARKWDWLISANPHSSAVFRSAFAYDGPILESGYPRNDHLVGQAETERTGRRADVRRWLGLRPDQTAVLWAPTWRDDTYAGGGRYGASMLVDPGLLDAMLPADVVVLFHGHHLMSSVSGYFATGSRLRNVSGHPGLESLVLASDVLVTDYSSIMFDYALTGRPVIHYAPDLRHYERTRGLYLELASIAAGPVVSGAGELVEALRCLPDLAGAYDDARTALRRRFCPLDDGAATERVWDKVKPWAGPS